MSAHGVALPDPDVCLPRRSELPLRALCVAALLTLFFALWTPYLDTVTTWTSQEMRVLPRITLFAAVLFGVLLLQGAIAKPRLLVSCGVLLILCNFWLINYTQLHEYNMFQAARTMSRNMNAMAQSSHFTAETGAMGNEILLAGPVLQWLAFITSILGALLLGTWLARDITNSTQFLMLIVCAAAGDFWLSRFSVPDTESAGVLRFLRVSWPARITTGSVLPLNLSLLDVIVASALLASARTLRFPMVPLLLGALAGYSGATFLALEPWPGRPELGMLMCGSGVLVACWPELKCDLWDTGKALLLGSLLLLCLFGMSSLQRKLNPPPQPPQNASRLQGVT